MVGGPSPGPALDMPDRTFHSVRGAWLLSSGASPSDVKELLPELFYLPDFLTNAHRVDFGRCVHRLATTATWGQFNSLRRPGRLLPNACHCLGWYDPCPSVQKRWRVFSGQTRTTSKYQLRDQTFMWCTAVGVLQFTADTRILCGSPVDRKNF